MYFADIINIIKWWGSFLLLGLICMPICLHFFSSFFDKGYIFSKAIGVILLSYIVFIFGITHIFSFTPISITFAILVLGVVNIFLIQKRKKENIMAYIKIFAFEELLFFLGLFFWSYIRATQPNINGLEKFMDFGFINSILRSTYFPPVDMWYPPLPINYYYFGHLITGVLTKFTAIPSNVSFNLMVAAIFSITVVSSFSLGINILHAFFLEESGFKKTYSFLKRIVLLFAGLSTSFILSFGGNLQTVYAFFKPYTGEDPKPLWELAFSPLTFPNSYWYPSATRFIYHTIHEFPIYSFVVSDLHGHVLDIPAVLLTIAMLVSLFFTNFGKGKVSYKTLISVGFLLGVMYMTNAWDGGIYLLGSIIVAGCIVVYKQPGKLFEKLFSFRFFLYVATLFCSFLLFTLPFSLFFKAGELVSGIGVLCAPSFLQGHGKLGLFLFEPNHCQHSYIWELGILYGFFYFCCIGLLAYLYKQKKIFATDYFALILIGLATILIIIPEFFYLKDIYPAHYRANTMFKLVYQAFILLSISSGYSIFRILLSKSKKNPFFWMYVIFGLFLFFFVAIYPTFAIPSYYGSTQVYKGLDGTKYLQTSYPTDYAAILWLNTHVLGQPVTLEAQGDSYTDYERVSANTGLPTVLGWTVHEWLWRGSYDILPERINDVQKIYESSSLQETKSLLKKYDVQFVFIGDLERKKYTYLNEYKFSKLGKLVFRDKTTSIYSVK